MWEHRARRIADNIIRPGLTGLDLIQDPALNKGTAFTEEERRVLGLTGLLPAHVSTIEEQASRIMENFHNRRDDIEKYVHMSALQDRNETLFYRVVSDHIEAMLPIIYTPTVGKACQVFAHIFRRSRGMFITRQHRGVMREVLHNWPVGDVRVIVVTDGERILGLGDLGANGMGIPIGKLALYTACAGVHPALTLPVMLDVGTHNKTLRADPLYLGLREDRLTGAAYDEVVDEFMLAVREVFPRALIQFEDFANHNAFRLLAKYRDQVCTFNDDIQGTAAVTLAGLLSAMQVTRAPLAEQVLLFAGAGEAAVGIANLVVQALVTGGMAERDARRRCWFVDSKGLVESRRQDLQEHKRAYAHEHAPTGDLFAAVKALRPTALIGVSATAKQFTREIIEEMTRLNARPVVFALSNPTSQAECTAEEAYGWSKGKVLFASGSPFPPCQVGGKTYVPGQGNNAYVFPGVGLGVVVSGARRVTDEMFLAAARTLAAMVSEKDLESGCLFPSLTRIRDVSAHIAAAVAAVAYARELASEPRPADLLARVRERQYQPIYPRYV